MRNNGGGQSKSKPSQKTCTFLNLIECKYLENVIRLASRHVGRHGKLHPEQLCAVWVHISQLLFVTDTRNWDANTRPRFKQQLKRILARTVNSMDSFGPKDLVGTILAMAKVVKHVPLLGNDWWLELFQELLLGYEDIFQSFANVSTKYLPEFNDRCLSNFAYAYALVGGRRQKYIFDQIAMPAMRCLGTFSPQSLSVIVWAYAKAEASHTKLFEMVAYTIIDRDLETFNSQNLSNIVWAFATAEESNSQTFDKVAATLIARDLSTFNPQELKDIVWAYAKAGHPTPELFREVADAIVTMDVVATFTSQELSNTSWAFATANEYHPELFDAISYAAIANRADFNAQEVANLLWAFATVYRIDHTLFSSFAPTATSLIEEEGIDIQNLANIAWAFSVSNIADPGLFGSNLVNALSEKESEINDEALCQLHQWNLWQQELNSNIFLPPTLQGRCYEAFISNMIQVSDFQFDVVCGLRAIGFQPLEEVLMPSGYILDALVEVYGQSIGIEVDGPYHFIGKEPKGKTILKRRQVHNIDGIPIVSVPYWEWHQFGNNGTMKQEYLCALLGL